MPYTQVKPFNQAQAGTTKNFCLANVTKGYGIPNRYASAWQAWENTQQHAGDAPEGLDVPAYFSYTATIDNINKNWGHIGVRLANGQFWSDGTVYSSIAAYTKNHSPRYVGWGESVNNVTVIKQGEIMPNVTDVRNAFKQYGVVGKTGVAGVPSDDQIRFYTSNPWTRLLDDLLTFVANRERTSVNGLKAQLANSSEANLLGQALIKLLATFGYKKG